MSGLALKTICPGLLDELNVLASNAHRSELDISRVIRSAQPLKKAAPDEYYMIVGICESLKGRLDMAVQSFEKAITLGGWNTCLAENYAISLHEAGDIEGAWAVIDRGLESFGADPDYLSDIMNTLINTGAIKKANEVEQRLVQLQVIDGGNAHWGDYISAVESSGLSIEMVGEIIRRAVALVKRTAVARPTMFYSFTTEGGRGPHLALGIMVPLTVARTHALEMQMLEDIYSFVEEREEARTIGDPSILDWISLHLRSEDRSHAALHAA